MCASADFTGLPAPGPPARCGPAPASPAETPEILVLGLPSRYEAEHLARVFFPMAAVRAGGGTRGPLVYARASAGRLAVGLRLGGACHVATAPPVPPARRKRALTRLLYDLLKEITGLRPPWGLLTGVRPINLLRGQMAAGGPAAAQAHLLGACDVSLEKYALAREIYDRQQPLLARFPQNAYSLYVSIPFCPSRCAYCSFVSRTIGRDGALVDPYLEKLEAELTETAAVAAVCGLRLATVYIGGGTPTALDAAQLERLLQAVQRHFDAAGCMEYTVEAGRPDCTGPEKLALLKKYGAGRISINPQSLQDAVLQANGRGHTAGDILRCYADARAAGHRAVNMDLIAGLPGDDAAGFAKTLADVIQLKPENVTVHTLTLKRASDIAADRRAGASPGAMVAAAAPALRAAGYAPYYLYRQKSGVENLENTGWALPGTEGLYNIAIMEEAHTILAVGAGASTKLVLGGGRTIKRFYNHKFPLEYIRNFEEVIRRKRGVTAFYAGHLDTEAPG